jgi:hypothetical protein
MYNTKRLVQNKWLVAAKYGLGPPKSPLHALQVAVRRRNIWNNSKYKKRGGIWGSHGGEYEDGCLLSSPWWWRQYGHLKRWWTYTGLHGAATEKTAICMEREFSVPSLVVRLSGNGVDPSKYPVSSRISKGLGVPSTKSEIHFLSVLTIKVLL